LLAVEAVRRSLYGQQGINTMNFLQAPQIATSTADWNKRTRCDSRAKFEPLLRTRKRFGQHNQQQESQTILDS
jgi:hypothetical protein